MKLGVHVGYWGLGMGPAEQLRGRARGRAARLRLGLGRRGLRVRRGDGARLARGRHEKIKLGSAIFQMPGRSAGDDGDDRRDDRPALGRPDAAGDRLVGPAGRRGLARPAVRAPAAAHARVRRGRAQALARERLEFHGETLELPLPDGPGKPLKLTIAPVQERIPIYLAAIGPKNTALAGEIADGWIPTLLLPRARVRAAGVARGGRGSAPGARSTASTSRRPSTPTSPMTAELARNLMRPVLALYIGGMGSREQNFYNKLVQRYGFEDAAKEIQDLYLDGKQGGGRRGDPRRADRHGLAGRARATSCAIASRRSATRGVGTLMITPMAFTRDDRIEQLRAGRRAGGGRA